MLRKCVYIHSHTINLRITRRFCSLYGRVSTCRLGYISAIRVVE